MEEIKCMTSEIMNNLEGTTAKPIFVSRFADRRGIGHTIITKVAEYYYTIRKKRECKKFLILTTFYAQLEDIRSLEQKLQLFKEAVFKIARADEFEEACELWSVDHPLSRILPTTLAGIQTVQANAYNHANITPVNSAPPENDPFDLPEHTYLQQLLNLDGTLDLFDV